jgi:hypothetical protein
MVLILAGAITGFHCSITVTRHAKVLGVTPRRRMRVPTAWALELHSNDGTMMDHAIHVKALI